jgi:hypothetical protein
MELLDFQGIATRSIDNDTMNDFYSPEYKTWVRFFFSLILISFMLFLELLIIIGLFYLMLFFEGDNTFPEIPFIEL